MIRHAALIAVALLITLFVGFRAAGADVVNSPNRDIDVIEHLGEKIPLDIVLSDNQGRVSTLGEYFGKERPVILSLVYYECPMLCSLVSQGLVRSMRSIDLELGRDYDAVTVSFDPGDTVQAAATKRTGYLEALDRHDSEAIWPFFVAKPEAIQRLTDAVGFKYVPVPGSRDLAHAAVIFVLSPDGTLSRYLYGVEYSPRDLRLALVEASAGKVGTTLDRVLLRCYRYDPATRRYALFISTYLRMGGVVILLVAGGLLYRMWRRELRANTEGGTSGGVGLPP